MTFTLVLNSFVPQRFTENLLCTSTDWGYSHGQTVISVLILFMNREDTQLIHKQIIKIQERGWDAEVRKVVMGEHRWT
jgi:hypothetical protein